MELSARALNRTLLARQHLLSRTTLAVAGMVEHLVGVQAQEPWSPYFALAARLDPFDPYDVSAGLEDRSLVRLLSMRSTVHLLVADDALSLRRWTQPISTRERKASQNTRPALHLDPADVAVAVSRALADGPLPMKRLGEVLAEAFPGVPPSSLAHLARVDLPLAQLPPRGSWRQSGQVVYEYVDRWVGRSLVDPDPAAIVRRYLAAYGPASAADLTTWSGITGMPALLTAMPDLERHSGPDGRPLYDVPGGLLADEDVRAPVRLLGQYDNVWLSHSGRDRVTDPAKRRRWMGSNGGVCCTVFVDGWLEGLWRLQDGGPVVVDLFRDLTRQERSELDDELSRLEALLAR